ncbi:MAG: hypothetical protein NHB14_06000 [Desulfosporosinus sp.]|nr:hypothetical protein [Desulfosporosinus sp.]
MAANISVSSLFPEESLEVRAQNSNGNAIDANPAPNVQKDSEHNNLSDLSSKTTENHSYTKHSENQSQSSAGSTSSIKVEPNASSHSPINQLPQVTAPEPPPETSHEWSKPSSDQISLTTARRKARHNNLTTLPITRKKTKNIPQRNMINLIHSESN